ncbi:helix-turn-helix domain-containing protein [Bosea vaviloviae]|uniref:helix-turn-helix domain-containing protein n=1 Tax=Bosea vaviloviae TaxID=1526658 RepID=UPI0009F40639
MHDFNLDLHAINSLVGHAVADVERDLILATLRNKNGNRTRAAHVLCISVRTLRNRLSVYSFEGYDVPESGQVPQ